MKSVVLYLASIVLVTSQGAASDAAVPSADRVKALLDSRSHEEARSMGEELLGLLEARGEDGSLEAAGLLDLLVRAARQRNDYGDPVRQMAARALAIKESLQGPGHPGVADTLFGLSMLLFEAADYEGARPIFDRVLAIREKALGPDDLAVSEVLLQMANNIQMVGEFAEAKPLFERALAISEKRLGPQHADVATVLHNSANLHLRMGEFVEARRRYQRALAIRRAVLGPRHIDVALTYVTMGVLYQNMGDYDEAREVLEEAIVICREGEWRDSLLLSGALNNLGNVHWSLGEAGKARDAYQEALDIKLKRQGPDHPDLVLELNNLALAHKRLGDYDAAIPLLERAIRLVETRLGSDHFNLSHPLNNLANLLVLKGRYAEARPLLERTLGIRVATLGRRHPEVSQTIMNLSGLALAEGKRAQALGLAREASDLALGRIRDILAYLPESAALDLASSQDEPHTILFEGLRTAKDDEPDWLEACWDWALQRKGIVLEEMAARHRSALLDESAGTRSAREDLGRARSELAGLWAEGPGDRDPAAYQQTLKETVDRKESAEEKLAGLSARFRGERVRRNADLAAVRRSLRPGEALVDIARVEIGLPALDRKPVHDVALVVRPDGAAAWEDLGPAEQTDRLVMSWRAELSDGFERREDPAAADRLERAGRDLRRAVWDPIARHLAGARLILIAPDGPLHQVDLGALPSDSGRFVIEETPPMQVLGAGRDVVARAADASAASVPRRRGLLALGAPDFKVRAPGLAPQTAGSGTLLRGTGSTCAAVRERTWEPLPESAREVEMIAGLIEGREPVTVVTGARAVEEVVFTEAPERRILHIATHGFFLGSCGGKAESPLLRSGLVLAGANHVAPAGGDAGGGDGILTAEEIVGTDLRGVDLAVLSACDTGRGEVAVGEGVFGLRRALEIAGVRTVVMSLWPVPDRQARRWMGHFYRGRVLEGAVAREAARRASLSLLEELRAKKLRAHPYLWTGFVVAGSAD
ncbi:MAG: tetratricopeptide repeat protein [Candidatus Polarisedimenticolia bacterium]